MGKCVNHPDRETSYHCMKHNVYQCDECLQCRDPELYCKFRSACPIYFLTQKNFDSSAESAGHSDSEEQPETVMTPDSAVNAS